VDKQFIDGLYPKIVKKANKNLGIFKIGGHARNLPKIRDPVCAGEPGTYKK